MIPASLEELRQGSARMWGTLESKAVMAILHLVGQPCMSSLPVPPCSNCGLVNAPRCARRKSLTQAEQDLRVGQSTVMDVQSMKSPGPSRCSLNIHILTYFRCRCCAPPLQRRCLPSHRRPALPRVPRSPSPGELPSSITSFRIQSRCILKLVSFLRMFFFSVATWRADCQPCPRFSLEISCAMGSRFTL